MITHTNCILSSASILLCVLYVVVLVISNISAVSGVCPWCKSNYNEKKRGSKDSPPLNVECCP